MKNPRSQGHPQLHRSQSRLPEILPQNLQQGSTTVLLGVVPQTYVPAFRKLGRHEFMASLDYVVSLGSALTTELLSQKWKTAGEMARRVKDLVKT